MTEKNKNAIPQFVACGLEMGNCKRQIPYDMTEHERIIMTELLDKVAKRLKSEFPIMENDFGLIVNENVHKEVDKVIAEMKSEFVEVR